MKKASRGHRFDFEHEKSSPVRLALSAIARSVSKPEHHRVLAAAVAESPVLRNFISRHVLAILEGKSKLHVSINHAISAAGQLGGKQHADALEKAFIRLDRRHLGEKAAIMTTLFNMGHHDTHSGNRFLRRVRRDETELGSLRTFAGKLLQTAKVKPSLRNALGSVLSESHNPLEIDFLDEITNKSPVFRKWLGNKVVKRLQHREGWNLAHAFAAAVTLHKLEKANGNSANRYALAILYHFKTHLPKTDATNRRAALHALDLTGFYHTNAGSHFLERVAKSTEENENVARTAQRMLDLKKKPPGNQLEKKK